MLDLSRLAMLFHVSAHEHVDFSNLWNFDILCRFVVVKKHLFGMHGWLSRAPLVQGSAAGSRAFHTMVQGNRKCCGPQVALKPAIPNVSRRSIRWFLSLGADISKVVKRLLIQ
ncbi:hypothetical protein V6N13_068291 [Hibiscus sabdariffa]|uniref:Uncharacterized protein n=1 Tax=Hibiscus sabdariffa TaxID=183260 RepID=A0ABR2QMP2_9ROSI